MSKQSLRALDEDSIPTETDLMRLVKELGDGLTKVKGEEFKYEAVSFSFRHRRWFEEENKVIELLCLFFLFSTKYRIRWGLG